MPIALFFLFLLLPAYVVRFSIGPLPTTVLEVAVWIVACTWLFLSSQPSEASGGIPCLANKETLGSKKGIPPLRALRHFCRNDITKNKLLLAGTTLFFLGATIGIFVSSDTRAALGEWKAFYVEPILIFFIIISFFQSSKLKPIPYTLYPLLLSSLIVSTFAIYQHFTGFGVPYSFWANANTFRVTAWYGYPNAVGLFLAPLIPLSIYLLTERRNLKIDHWSLSIFPILFLSSSILAILFAKGSGPLIGVAVGIISLFIFNKTTRWPTIVICLLSILSLFGLSKSNSIHQELFADNRSGHIRQAIWHETARFLTDHPIAGAGLASYSQKIIPYHTRVDGEGIEIFSLPHNLFLSIWVNTGLTGLIGFLLILIWFFHTAWHISRSLTTTPYTLSPAPFTVASMITLLTMGLVDTPYIKNDLSIFFWLLIALMYLAQSQPRHSPLQPTP